MKFLAKSALVALALAACTISASAAVNFTASPDPGAYGPGEAQVWDFDSIANPNFSYAGSIGFGDTFGVSTSPAGDASLYGYAGSGETAVFEALTGNLASLSVYIGTVDDYNTIGFYNGASLVQAFSGSALLAITDGSDHRYLFTFGASDNVNRVLFSSDAPAFEFDYIAASFVSSGVPEPGTWAMMILGFGFIGFMLRAARRREANALRAT